MVQAAALTLGGLYVSAIPAAMGRGGDFLHLYTIGSVAAHTPSGLYDPHVHEPIVRALQGDEATWTERAALVGVNFYPPTMALAYAPLGLLPYPAAAGVQAVASLLAAAGAALALARLSAGRLAPELVLLAILLSPSFLYSFVLGQNGAFVLLVLSLAALAWFERRDAWAGAVLSLVTWKPSWALGVGWVLFARPRAAWGPAVLAFVAATATACALAAALFGPARFLEYAEVARLVAQLDRLPNYPTAHQHNLIALSRAALGVGPATDVIGLSLGAAVVAATAWRVHGRAWSLEVAGLCFLAGTLANPHVHHYDLLPVTVAIAALAAAWPAVLRDQLLTAIVLVVWFTAAWVGDAWALPVSVPALANLLLWAWSAYRAGGMDQVRSTSS